MPNNNSNEELNQRIEELETKISFQDFSIEELNQVLIQQQNDMNKLTKIVESVISQVEKISDSHSDGNNEVELPPHY